jgi:hypothetical protein
MGACTQDFIHFRSRPYVKMSAELRVSSVIHGEIDIERLLRVLNVIVREKSVSH